MAYDFRSAGFELTNIVINLYRTRTYRRAAEEMSKNMLQSSVTAGQLISAVQDYTGAEEAAAAEKAIRSLDDMVYVVSTMKRMGVYTGKALSSVMKLARTIKARLIDVIVENRSATGAAQAPKTAQQVQSSQPAQQAPKTAQQSAASSVSQSAQSAQNSAGEQTFVDEDGFYDDATEYL